MEFLFVLLLFALLIIVFIVGLRVLDLVDEWNVFLGALVGAGLAVCLGFLALVFLVFLRMLFLWFL